MIVLHNFKVIFQSRNAVLMLLASVMSRFGDWFYVTALSALVTKAGGLGTLAFITSFRFACMIILMPIGGAIVENHNKIKVMILSDILRFIMMLGLIIVAVLLPNNLILLAGLASATAFLSIFFSPARRAILPKIVEEQYRTSLNALDGIVGTATLAIAPAIGGFLLSYLDYSVIFAINGIGFLMSVIFILSIKQEPFPLIVQDVHEDKIFSSKKSWLNDSIFGLKELIRNKETRYITILAFSSHLVVGSTWIFVAAVSFSLNYGGAGIGYLSSVIGLGSVLGLLLGGGARDATQKKQTAAAIAMLSLTVLCWTAFQNSFIGSLITCFFLGVFANIFEAPCWSILQKETMESSYARVFSAFDAITLGAMLIGTYLSALLITKFDISHSIFIIGLVSLFIFLVAITGYRKSESVPCDSAI